MARPTAYDLYGIHIRTALALRSAPTGRGEDPPDISIVDGPTDVLDRLSALPRRSPERDRWFTYALADDGSLYLRWEDLFEFAVDPDGRTITARPLTRGTAGSFETYLLSQVLSCSLLRLGLEPIHATVLEVGGRGIGLMAEPGYGKSTLAASFLAGGHRLLTDDLMVVTGTDPPRVEPGPRRIKLFPDPATMYLPELSGTPINDRTEKSVFALPGRYVAGLPAPLTRLYVMRNRADGSSRQRITIRSLSAKQAFLELTKASFNSILVDADRLRVQFDRARSIVASVPLKSLSYPAGLSRLDDVRDAVLEDVAR